MPKPYTLNPIPMRHRVFGKKFSRDIKQRKSLFKNLITSLVMKEEIQTTESKAKAIKGLADSLIASGKKGTLHVRRTIAAFLQNKKAVNKIVDELGPRFRDRVSGFTRIIRVGERRGDNAMLVRIELIEKKRQEQARKDKESKPDSKKDLSSEAPAKQDKGKKENLKNPAPNPPVIKEERKI